MADGTYERRGPREAELKRLQRIINEAKKTHGGDVVAVRDSSGGSVAAVDRRNEV